MSCDPIVYEPYEPVRSWVAARKKKRRKIKEAVRRMHKQEAKRRAIFRDTGA